MTTGDTSHFELSVPRVNGEPLQIPLAAGEILFCLGANGSGKSSLLQFLYVQCPGVSKRITAQRRNWLESSSPDLTPEQRRQEDSNINQWSKKPSSRYSGSYEGSRPRIALFDLVAAENARARRGMDAIDRGDTAGVMEVSNTPSPIDQINTLLSRASLPVSIS